MTTQAPAITSADCMYATSDGSGHFTAGHVTATGIPAPTLSLVNPPSWLGLGNQVITYPGSGAPTTSALLKDLGTVADGQYTVPVEATNSVSTDIKPLSLAIEPGSSPAFISDNTATATAGTRFDFGVHTANCPAINDYSLQGVDAATSSWLTINNETGELSGTPTAAAAGTHTFTETVTVTNHGQWPATSVRTAVTVPSQLTVTADPGGTKTGPVISWTDASLGTNQSVTYTITFKVAPKARGTALIAAATASPKVADPKPLNNAALITVKLG